MKETLNCNHCSKNWRRDKIRGRKPHYCPKCIKVLSLDNAPIFIKKISTSKPLQKVLVESAKPKTGSDKTWIESPSYWQCLTCLVSIGVEIKINEPPTHRCQKRANRSYALEQIKKKPFK
jgi:hypothetical protein